MISPNQYRKLYKDKNLNELISVKEKLESEIERLSKEDNNNSIFLADTRLSMNSEYLEEIKKLIVEKEKNIRFSLKEYIADIPNDNVTLSIELYSNHFLLSVKPHTIFYGNKTINDENKYNSIIKIIENNIGIIGKLDLDNTYSYKGGLQEIIDIKLDNDNYIVIGNTDNQEMKQLYNKIKNEIIDILG